TQEEGLSPIIQKWVTGIKQLAAISTRFPHSAYAGLILCVSAEWQYICWMVPDVGPSLVPVETALCTKFLPAILGTAGLDDKLRTLLGNGVKTRGMAIRDPTLAAASLYSTSVEATDMLASTLIEMNPSTSRHTETVYVPQKNRRNGEAAFHTAPMERSTPKVKKQMEHATTAGACLSTIRYRFSGTKLTKDEWLGSIAIRYGQHPTNLPNQCNGCGASLTLEHGISCKRDGLIGICHNDVCDEWAHLCSIALTDSQVVIEPTIFYGNGLHAG
ncbi:hypothetical protein ACHAW6_016112, partial [Cyclotella cf. meneghiniana]